MQFQRLFSPLKVGSMTVPNRIFATTHGNGYATDNLPGDELQEFWMERVRGGLGLIISEPQSIHPTSTSSPRVVEIYRDEVVPRYKKIVDAIHGGGTKIFGQLWHAGRLATSGHYLLPIWAPSPLRPKEREAYAQGGGAIPHEMDEEDIAQLIESYRRSASYLKEAGFDGVEINAAQGFLLCEFISPMANVRQDKYGGSLENRLRLPIEVINAVREAVGSNLVLGVRMGPCDPWGEDLSLPELKEIARRLEATGKVDFLVTTPAMAVPMSYPVGAFAEMAQGVKEVVKLPVLYMGRMNDPAAAEVLLADGGADMVGMSRATLCDPDLVNKTKEGRLREIRKCLGCNDGCVAVAPAMTGTGIVATCAINPVAGIYKDWPILPASTKKRVMIVGGGIAGMEAARVCVLRGHQVSLYEKERGLGGQVNVAVRAPYRQDLGEAVKYYEYQMELLGVEMHLGVEVTPATVKGESPDTVVLATGSIGLMPDIPGVGGRRVVEMGDVLMERAEVGRRVLIALGEPERRAAGLSVAEFLADRGRQVEVLTPHFYAGDMLDTDTQELAYKRLLGKKVTFSPITTLKAVEGDTVVVSNTFTQEERRLSGVDTVVIAYGGVAQDGLYHELKGLVKEMHLVGDCVSPRTIRGAVRDGGLAGRGI